MIAVKPVINNETPVNIPINIDIANTGLVLKSSRIVSPAGIDQYSEFVNEVPMKKNVNIKRMRHTENLPGIDFGKSLKV